MFQGPTASRLLWELLWMHSQECAGRQPAAERAPCGCVWALCCAPGTVTGRSFLISDSSFGVVARIVPNVALFAPAPTPSPKVTLAAKGTVGTKDRRSRYEGKQAKRAPPVWPGSRGRRTGHGVGGAGRGD